jgi:hypothetical protein
MEYNPCCMDMEHDVPSYCIPYVRSSNLAPLCDLKRSPWAEGIGSRLGLCLRHAFGRSFPQVVILRLERWELRKERAGGIGYEAAPCFETHVILPLPHLRIGWTMKACGKTEPWKSWRGNRCHHASLRTVHRRYLFRWRVSRANKQPVRVFALA